MKNIVKLHVLLPLIFATYAHAQHNPDNLSQYAVITHNVLELNRHKPHEAADSTFPASPETKKCHRDHQGLINEWVQIVETNGDAVKIKFSDLIYDFDNFSHKPLTTFWTYKKYLMNLEQLTTNNLLSALPHPAHGAQPTIVLTYPWNNFSVGTRFKHIPENNTQDGFAIVRIDYAHSSIMHDIVPFECARIETKPENAQQARQVFVGIINTFLDRVAREGVVPFVWGGSSFLHPYSAQETAYLKAGVWHRKGSENKIYYGYDASQFVWRMAQIAGIYSPYKTTWTMEQSLHPLTINGQLENGDLIWAQGSIMIVSSIENNEVVIAHGYTSGYGCVHKLKLSKSFQGINTYADLVADYHAGKPLVLLGKDGQVIRTCETFKLLRLID